MASSNDQQQKRQQHQTHVSGLIGANDPNLLMFSSSLDFATNRNKTSIENNKSSKESSSSVSILNNLLN